MPLLHKHPVKKVCMLRYIIRKIENQVIFG